MSTQLRRWEPFRELETMRDAMDRVFEDAFFRPMRRWQGVEGMMSVDMDMLETDKDVVLKLSLPGVKPEEVDISVTGDTLSIRGEHKEEKESKEENYLLKERRYGSFSRTVQLPVPVKSDKAEASFENGVLTLTLPKQEEAKPKQIKVKARGAIEEPKKS
ncbi:MAG: Hsp20/alpha crystallin family protein [Chloroflexi bacterium]|nr:Hsp20/alpha crystallin family protein [Chloroflexota bacterium]